jgi:hypothetical protein
VFALLFTCLQQSDGMQLARNQHRFICFWLATTHNGADVRTAAESIHGDAQSGRSIMRAELIRKLVEANHLTVPERHQLAPASIHLSELLAVIRGVVEREQRFRSPSAILEQSAVGQYRVHRLMDPFNQMRAVGHGGSGNAARVLFAGTMSSDTPLLAGTCDYPTLESALQAFVAEIVRAADYWGQPPGTIDGVGILGLSTQAVKARNFWQRIRGLFGSGGPPR